MGSLIPFESIRRDPRRLTGHRIDAKSRLASAKVALLPGEDKTEWEKLLAGLTEEHQPSTRTEEFLVLEMARAQWRMNRLGRVKQEITAGDNKSNVAGPRQLMMLERWESSIRTSSSRALNTLMKLRRSKRRQKRPVTIDSGRLSQ